MTEPSPALVADLARIDVEGGDELDVADAGTGFWIYAPGRLPLGGFEYRFVGNDPDVRKQAAIKRRMFETIPALTAELAAANVAPPLVYAPLSPYLLLSREPLGSIEDVSTLKAGDGPDLLIQGSSTLYPQLIEAGLLDRLTLMIFPVVLGAGKRLLGDGTPARALRLVDQTVTKSGALIATYEPVGDIGHGWPGPQSTSARETERQRRIGEACW